LEIIIKHKEVEMNTNYLNRGVREYCFVVNFSVCVCVSTCDFGRKKSWKGESLIKPFNAVILLDYCFIDDGNARLDSEKVFEFLRYWFFIQILSLLWIKVIFSARVWCNSFRDDFSLNTNSVCLLADCFNNASNSGLSSFSIKELI